MNKERHQQETRWKVVRWAEEHGWLVNPSKGYEYFVERHVQMETCPCDGSGDRNECPCEQSATEVAEKGHCLCRLYYRDWAAFKQCLKPISGVGGKIA